MTFYIKMSLLALINADIYFNRMPFTFSPLDTTSSSISMSMSRHLSNSYKVQTLFFFNWKKKRVRTYTYDSYQLFSHLCTLLKRRWPVPREKYIKIIAHGITLYITARWWFLMAPTLCCGHLPHENSRRVGHTVLYPSISLTRDQESYHSTHNK